MYCKYTLSGFGMKMVGMSNPVLFNVGRLHNSCTICIMTLCRSLSCPASSALDR